LYIEDEETVSLPIADTDSLKSPNPNKGEVSEDVSVEESVDESTEESKDTVNENGEIIYIVKAGDILSRIAARYNLDYHDLAYYNGIENPSLIEVDQIIKIPPSDWVRPKDDVISSTDESTVDESSSAGSENNQ
jgi:LysM repeat protein